MTTGIVAVTTVVMHTVSGCVCVLLGATCRSDAGSQEGHIWGQDSGPCQCKAPQAVQEGLQAEA